MSELQTALWELAGFGHALQVAIRVKPDSVVCADLHVARSLMGECTGPLTEQNIHNLAGPISRIMALIVSPVYGNGVCLPKSIRPSGPRNSHM